jgi:hypothetical protein
MGIAVPLVAHLDEDCSRGCRTFYTALGIPLGILFVAGGVGFILASDTDVKVTPSRSSAIRLGPRGLEF